jgi:hypothetical protein
MSLTDRPTGELVVLIFAAALGSVLVAFGTGIVILELTHPEVDTTTSVAALGNVITVLAGAIVGYLAGGARRNRPRDEEPP